MPEFGQNGKTLEYKDRIFSGDIQIFNVSLSANGNFEGSMTIEIEKIDNLKIIPLENEIDLTVENGESILNITGSGVEKMEIVNNTVDNISGDNINLTVDVLNDKDSSYNVKGSGVFVFNNDNYQEKNSFTSDKETSSIVQNNNVIQKRPVVNTGVK